jgi:hypothetical protein
VSITPKKKQKPTHKAIDFIHKSTFLFYSSYKYIKLELGFLVDGGGCWSMPMWRGPTRGCWKEVLYDGSWDKKKKKRVAGGAGVNGGQ